MDTDWAKTLLRIFTPLIFMLPWHFFFFFLQLLFFLSSCPLKYLNESIIVFLYGRSIKENKGLLKVHIKCHNFFNARLSNVCFFNVQFVVKRSKYQNGVWWDGSPDSISDYYYLCSCNYPVVVYFTRNESLLPVQWLAPRSEGSPKAFDISVTLRKEIIWLMVLLLNFLHVITISIFPKERNFLNNINLLNRRK